MSSKDIVRVYSLSKNTKETKKIKMFQADPETLSSFRSLRGKVKSLFGMYSDITELFWKGR